MNKNNRGRPRDSAIWDMGKKSKRCSTCKEWKPFKFFKPKDRWYSWCEKCRSERGKYYRKTSRYSEKVKELKKLMMKMKGGVCQHCGISGHPSIFDFHHVDPSSKKLRLSGVRILTEKVREELAKCILLCSNCHRTHHWKEKN